MPALAQALKDRDYRVRTDAGKALASIGGVKAIPALAEVAKNDVAWPVRIEMLEVLSGFGPDAEGVIPAMIEALKDPEGGVAGIRNRAALALKKVGPKAKAAVPALVAALHAPDQWGQFRMDAAVALWHIDKNPAVLPALAEIFRDKDLSDRGLAASRLCEIGSAGVPVLVKALGTATRSCARGHRRLCRNRPGGPSCSASAYRKAEGRIRPGEDLCGRCALVSGQGPGRRCRPGQGT